MFSIGTNLFMGKNSMKPVGICVQSLMILFFSIIAGGCGVRYFPASAEGMPKEQLAMVIPETLHTFDSGIRGTRFDLSVDDLANEKTSSLFGLNPSRPKAYARLASIRSLDLNTGMKAVGFNNFALTPLYLAPGKYEFFFECTIDKWDEGGSLYEAELNVRAQLDAKAGRTYVLSGTATIHGSTGSAILTFTEKP